MLHRHAEVMHGFIILIPLPQRSPSDVYRLALEGVRRMNQKSRKITWTPSCPYPLTENAPFFTGDGHGLRGIDFTLLANREGEGEEFRKRTLATSLCSSVAITREYFIKMFLFK
jgi:hypothetical protein